MSDVPIPQNLTDRQAEVLATLIRRYIETPEPVSSKILAPDVEFSSATIRNEMAVLEELGFIRSPHTSAGRVPTEEGYRYFVQYLLNKPQLPQQAQNSIRQSFEDAPFEMEARMQNATVILARQTRTAALITEPRLKNEHRFKHIQLISTQGRLVLMVLILQGGNIHQQMLILAEPVVQEILNHTSDVLNRVCIDQSADGVKEKSRALSLPLAREIGELAADALLQMNDLGSRVIYRTGLGHVLPEFEEDAVQQALQILEGQTNLDKVLEDSDKQQIGAVEVVIAGDGRWEEFSHLSLVLARYGAGQVRGTIGVLGPTRMRYGQAIPAVGFVAELVSQFLSDIHYLSSSNPDDTAEKKQ